MVFFSDQKGIAKGETKSYKRWKIALCHTENELCIEVVQRVRWREDATTVWTVGQERRGGRDFWCGVLEMSVTGIQKYK